MNSRERRNAILKIISTPDDLYQFGTTGQSSTNNANLSSTGCTHTGVRTLERIWHGNDITENDVSKVVGYTEAQKKADQGLTAQQLDKAFNHYGLPYQMFLNPSITQIRTFIDSYGPIGIAVGYDNYPEWMGYEYFGHKADGYPNGYARPFSESGRNQLVNARFGHFIIGFGHRDRNDLRFGLHRYWLHDPNHMSSARPEKSRVDFVDEPQLVKMMSRFPQISEHSNSTIVWAPLRQWNGKE